jgi:hypothetical protein
MRREVGCANCPTKMLPLNGSLKLVVMQVQDVEPFKEPAATLLLQTPTGSPSSNTVGISTE